ncbi:MAG: LytTR family DNA-binding domain-containing protein [Bacteroidota bacterium]|nr:LytTR family DNA-binding domain-containing protein [Bacteroidota bacterium]MDP4212993.1 LytTR family DNA-binding domain-containing protein [Bacteroidota bacterium]MDP4249981.1 LytTR family DNA-binding domain-containing protein [Bacteroidota bacterium]
MHMLKAILVDDELNSLQNLQLKIQEYCPSIRIAAQTQRPEEAIELIRQHKPDVIFLDIEMPRMSGFKMLEQMDDIDFEIIFITAYNHYAINAIRISAFDYLVKPVSIEDLQLTVGRLEEFEVKKSRERADILKRNLANPKTQEDQMAVPCNDGLEFIQIKQIIRIESSSNYSKLVLQSGKILLVTRQLKDFEELLEDYRFYRIHHSHLINLNYIAKYVRGEGGQITMRNGDIIDVSRRKKEVFLKLIGG